jgi:hypothetical protein
MGSWPAHAGRPGLAGWLLIAPALDQATPAAAPGAIAATERVEIEATSEQIGDFIRQRQARVLMFQGYSGAGYGDPAAMLAVARRVLAAHDPRTTLVGAGSTAQGIGEVCALARAAGFGTIGIVSTLARDAQVPLAAGVQRVFYVRDAQWGDRRWRSASACRPPRSPSSPTATRWSGSAAGRLPATRCWPPARPASRWRSIRPT